MVKYRLEKLSLREHLISCYCSRCILSYMGRCNCLWSQFMEFRRNSQSTKMKVRENALTINSCFLLGGWAGIAFNMRRGSFSDADPQKYILSTRAYIFWVIKWYTGLQNALVRALVKIAIRRIDVVKDIEKIVLHFTLLYWIINFSYWVF